MAAYKSRQTLSSKRRGRPVALTEEDVDRALRYTVRYGNIPAANYMNVSRSTIERLKRNRGLREPNFVQELVRDVAIYGIQKVATLRNISRGLVEDILKRSGAWIDSHDRNIEDLLR